MKTLSRRASEVGAVLLAMVNLATHAAGPAERSISLQAIRGTVDARTHAVKLRFQAGAFPFDDALIAARSDIAEDTELRSANLKDTDGLDLPLVAIPVPARGIDLARDGFFVLLKGISVPLSRDGVYPVTLVFLRSGEVAASFVVEPGS